MDLITLTQWVWAHSVIAIQGHPSHHLDSSQSQCSGIPSNMWMTWYEGKRFLIKTTCTPIDCFRTNLMVQFVNCQISYSARYSQIQPKMCMDGRFPNEFRVPRTVEEMKSMDRTSRKPPLVDSLSDSSPASTLDRLLRAYGLPTDLRSLRLTSQDSVSPKTAHQAKLCTLFDFLGATQISERQRMRRTACLPY